MFGTRADSGTGVVEFTFPCKSTQIEGFKLSYDCRKDRFCSGWFEKSDGITRFSFLCIDRPKMVNLAHTRCSAKILKLLSLKRRERTEPNNVEFIE
jgi:hypothetical protein